MLGIQPEPTVIEVVGWLLYAIPMLTIVLVARRRAPARARDGGRRRRSSRRRLVLLVGTLGGDEETSTAVASAGGAGRTVNVAITDAGCEPATLKLASGPTTFVVTNKGSAKVTEYEVIQRRPHAGRGREPRRRADAALLAHPAAGPLHAALHRRPTHENGVADGERRARRRRRSRRRCSAASTATARFLERETAVARRPASSALRAALAGGDVAAARRAYAGRARALRAHRAGGRVASATSTRASTRAPTTCPRSQWTGFHPIERRLWVQKHHRGHRARSPTASWPTSRELQRLVRTVKLEPAQVGNGANELLGEVSKSKITGEEERYSHTDLLDFQANVEGARAAFDAIRPALAGKDPELVDRDRAALRARRRGAATARARRRLRALHRAGASPRCAALSAVDRRAGRAALAGAGAGAVGLADGRLTRRGPARVRRGRRASPPRPGGGFALGREGDSDAGERGRRADGRPFHGAHQAGIATPAQDRLHFAAFDVDDDRARATCASCCARGPRRPRAMTAGRPVGDVNDERARAAATTPARRSGCRRRG